MMDNEQKGATERGTRESVWTGRVSQEKRCWRRDESQQQETQQSKGQAETAVEPAILAQAPQQGKARQVDVLVLSVCLLFLFLSPFPPLPPSSQSADVK